MKILLVSATPFEIAPTVDWLTEQFSSPSPTSYQKGELTIDVLISGVGLPITAFSLGSVLARKTYQLCIQAGIAGALDPDLNIGDVVEVISERFADLGAEDHDGRFLDLKQLGLQEQESGLFTTDGRLMNRWALQNPSGLPRVNGWSVNKASGNEANIAALKARYPEAQVESMEGAAFFYAALTYEVAMLQIRSISNHVTARNRDSWDIPLAIRNLNEKLLALLSAFEQ